MKRRGALFLLLLLLASCCCAERGAKEADEKKERHARKAASRWARRAGRRNTDLVTATGGLCHFLETEAFSETFTALNTTRWDASSMAGLFHCNRGTNEECTMAVPANFQLNSALPFYPTGNTTGATLTLTQSPCNDPYKRPACCGPPHHGRAATCANWTGAHLVSRGCILYGTLTAEMAMLMPAGSRAFLDVGTYVRGGTPDGTQNELDMIFRTLAVDLSSSDSTGAAAVSVNSSFVASTWDATFFNPGEHKQVFGPNSWPHYTGFMARQYHNYSITWTPHSITWSLDKVVYRTVTRLRRCQHRRCWGVPQVMLLPWRPQTIRVILRTSEGNTLAQQPDCTVFLRRVSYTPLPGRHKHAHPLRYWLRQLLFLFALAVVGGALSRCAWAALVGSAGDAADLDDAERRRRLEMTPLLAARAALEPTSTDTVDALWTGPTKRPEVTAPRASPHVAPAPERRHRAHVDTTPPAAWHEASAQERPPRGYQQRRQTREPPVHAA